MWSQKVSRYCHSITAANVGHNVFVMISSAKALNQTASVILLYYYLVRKILLWSWEGRTPENSGMRLYLFIWQSSLYNAIEIYKIINQNIVSLFFNYPEITVTKLRYLLILAWKKHVRITCNQWSSSQSNIHNIFSHRVSNICYMLHIQGNWCFLESS